MQLIDTHAHLYFDSFDDDLLDVLHRAREQGVESVINIGIDLDTSRQVVELAQRTDLPIRCYAAVGVHPNDCDEWGPEARAELVELIQDPNVLAVGEIGLDYFRAKEADRYRQDAPFRQQIELAIEQDLPIIIHCRDAYPEVVEVIQDYKGQVRGVCHCFAGTPEEALKLVDFGLHISFTGIVTFPKGDNIRDVANVVPLDRMMVETDAPFLAPQKFRGKRNEPSYVVEVAKELGRIRELSLDEVATLTTKNAQALFGIQA